MVRSILLLFAFLGLSISGISQITINAMVADSASLKPISFVNVRVTQGYKGTMTNEQGYFVLEVKETDTLTFSAVGYYHRKASVKELQAASVVYLTQAVTQLQPIEVRGVIDISAVLPKLDEESVYRNPTQNPRNFEVPGFQGLQTFGPGYVSRLGDLKPSKEEKKLKQIKKQNVAAKGYVALVNDPEVKDKIMKDYQLSEEQYYNLAIFNQRNKDFIYDLEDNEVIQLIFLYFVEVMKK